MTAKGKCPICGAPSADKTRPFCSARCADVDLARWLGGKYAIPTHADAEEDGAPPPPGQSNRRPNGDNDDD